MIVKVCGLMTAEDVKICNELKPDYVGFVFAPSKRKVSVETARRLIGQLDAKITSVGVFVNEAISSLIEIAQQAGLKAVQLHGDEDQDYIDVIRDKLPEIIVIKAIRGDSFKSFKKQTNVSPDLFLVDAYSENERGGTGKVADWTLARRLQEEIPLLLAGGLHPDNVLAAIDTVGPLGVDVSSGVEKQDGTGKDREKVALFIQRAKGDHNGKN